MKGQFFIISTVIIISALIIIVQYLYDYGRADLTKIQELRELDYIQNIKDTLGNAVKNSIQTWGCSRLENDLDYSITFLKNKLLEKGIKLDVSYTNNCPRVDFDFNISSSGYFSETSFTYE